jgi:hypothetical protein
MNDETRNMKMKTEHEWLVDIPEDEDSLLKMLEWIRSIQQDAILSAQSDGDAVWQVVDILVNALEIAKMTVECAGVDIESGEELPWYKQMKSALAKYKALKRPTPSTKGAKFNQLRQKKG